jgi:hypothetical protein
MSFQLAEMVNLHFLSLLEAMLECNSSVLSKLLPVWTPVLFSYHVQVWSVPFNDLRWHHTNAAS